MKPLKLCCRSALAAIPGGSGRPGPGKGQGKLPGHAMKTRVHIPAGNDMERLAAGSTGADAVRRRWGVAKW